MDDKKLSEEWNKKIEENETRCQKLIDLTSDLAEEKVKKVLVYGEERPNFYMREDTLCELAIIDGMYMSDVTSREEIDVENLAEFIKTKVCEALQLYESTLDHGGAGYLYKLLAIHKSL